MRKRHDPVLHLVLCIFFVLTILPFIFVLNNSVRTQSEQYRTYFALPEALKSSVRFTWYKLTGRADEIRLAVPKRTASGGASETETAAANVSVQRLGYRAAMQHLGTSLARGYHYAWRELRPYMLNTIVVCVATVLGVLLLGSVSGYVFSRYRFRGRRLLFTVLLSIIMIPPVLTLVPSFLLVKRLHLLNSYWVLILPYVAGGQIVAIFLFKSFFDGLPEELFESARLEGAGHFALYRHIVLPLSGQVAAVVAVMNILGVWNNFMWPFITNSDSKYHVVASGLYLMSESAVAQNFSAMYAAYILSSIPLIILFVYATKPFMQGVTSGAFKA
ncbi:MAG: carbohydrate ABC transporter permease [Candidatus Sumerlaeaceae bacterium]